ncbi:bifunctional folylpolyglutamate synthase/dihydrofolate synthase [Deinococcus cellulosilyticus]|uniref:tetrahydrofolate synthase n=1 Tax=Deinococcus cellulosilyticus (strain DSM 18568 / NBRC 106333 / KACC 11606 / 5516J-15) TaxID=1223518 RepID=A0A511NBH3_DEIC1|nr:folylpolyglutamate synthase/dihydrofolate synthase family protein [Deinococcus cellulosilyticus]GEM49916.1 bifunctional folylpolyglutamate synthase/dihydrofolate synthase [Deinococcus cellulosilyticus NBRC 106333 = KACC 11606]
MIPDYDWLYTRTRAGKDRTPERAKKLLALLGNPEKDMQVIHVIGTNGKGSVCAMLEAGLLAGKVQVGKFTSPHLTHFNERIRVKLREIPEKDVAAFIEWAKEHAPDMPFFELTLGMALQHFQKQKVEWAVIEAGVGGEKDATNALQNVAATLITNVDLDHQSTLGNTIAEIARDKAGAIRSGVPVLTTATGEALAVIKQIAEEREAPLYTPQNHPDLFSIPHPPRMTGAHQISNAWLALAALRVLFIEGHEIRRLKEGDHLAVERCGATSPFIKRLDQDLIALYEAALDAQHPGRMEMFKVGEKTIILDGAHNLHAARALAQNFQNVSTLLFGIMARKDARETLDALAPLAGQRFYTNPGDLGLSPDELAKMHPGQVIENPEEALKAALDATPKEGGLLVAGSLYLIGRIREKVLDMAQTQE